MSIYFKVLISSAKKIRVEKLEGDEILLFSAITANGNILIEKNTMILDRHKDLLQNWGMRFVIVSKPEEIWVTEKELNDKKMEIKEKVELDEQHSETIEKIIAKDSKDNVDDLKKISNDLKSKVEQINIPDRKKKINKIEKKINELIEKKQSIDNQIQNIDKEETQIKIKNALLLEINEIIEEVKQLDISKNLVVDIIEAENLQQGIKTELINEILEIKQIEKEQAKEKDINKEEEDAENLIEPASEQLKTLSFEEVQEPELSRKRLYEAKEEDKQPFEKKNLFTSPQENPPDQSSLEAKGKNVSSELLKEITQIDIKKQRRGRAEIEARAENIETKKLNIEGLLNIKQEEIRNIKEIEPEPENLTEESDDTDKNKPETDIEEDILNLVKQAQEKPLNKQTIDKPVQNKNLREIKSQELARAEFNRKQKQQKLKEKREHQKSSKELDILETFHKIYELPKIFSKKELEDIFLILNNIFDEIFYEAKVSESDLEKAVSLIHQIAEESKFIILDIAEPDDTLSYLFVHSVNVAIFAGILGKINNCSTAENRLLITAGIFHDMGMCFVPESFWHRPRVLTPRGRYEIKKHPLYSANLIKKILPEEKELYKIVLQHHERLDGTGYPYNIKAGKINFLAQILSAADVYEAMTADRFYRGNYSLDEVIKYFINNRNKYNWDILKTLIKKVGFYPNGSVVILSDNSIGFIKKQNPKNILKPIVQRILDKTRKVIKNEEEIDLEKVNLNIIRSVAGRKALINIKKRFNLWN